MMWVLALLLALTSPALARYRLYNVENADICKDKNTNAVNVGNSAVLLQLSKLRVTQPNLQKLASCNIHLKAAENHGLMVHVEEMFLRNNSASHTCVDYVQFGQDDFLPFFTIQTSDKFCGEAGVSRPGGSYDDPHGNLLIWIHLGSHRRSSEYPHINQVNLTLVVTPYQKQCSDQQNLAKCYVHAYCIHKDYFCDRHINCPLDLPKPADENGCSLRTPANRTIHEYPIDGSADSTGRPSQSAASLSWISWALIIVTVFMATILIVIVLFRIRSGAKCCCCLAGTDRSSCDFPERPVIHSLAELSSNRVFHSADENVYLPLHVFISPSQNAPPDTAAAVARDSLSGQGGSQDILEEPPPAYNDLFPAEAGRPD